jgi:hypothetical protein
MTRSVAFGAIAGVGWPAPVNGGGIGRRRQGRG